jgi:hypothetical protein
LTQASCAVAAVVSENTNPATAATTRAFDQNM